jgi:hypothetical protein
VDIFKTNAHPGHATKSKGEGTPPASGAGLTSPRCNVCPSLQPGAIIIARSGPLPPNSHIVHVVD